MKPVKKVTKKDVEEEPEDKREHVNIIFIGHVGKNLRKTCWFFVYGSLVLSLSAGCQQNLPAKKRRSPA